MLLSICLIILSGLCLGSICKLLKLPSLIGMLGAGIILGPFCLDLLDASILSVSADIRKIALVIILTRAGLGLDISGLKKIGRPAFMMCFVPASFELGACLLLGPALLGLSLLESAVIGSILAAVSPAVVVPRMVKLMDEGVGTEKGIPQLILAGASVDDVYVIVLFTTFVGMMQGDGVDILSFINIPVSIILGVAIGLLVGFMVSCLFKYVKMQDTVKVLVILSFSLGLVAIESMLKTPITFSGLIGIMFIGVALQHFKKDSVASISNLYNKLWVGAEIFLFVLVGACVNINYVGKSFFIALAFIMLALIIRMVGVFVCMLGTKFNKKERLFTMMAYTPKATVQAAIGGIPLSLGFACGEIALTVAVIAIIITAPLGAFAIDKSYKKLL